jgi:branched-chain amino acid transport system permease protein
MKASRILPILLLLALVAPLFFDARGYGIRVLCMIFLFAAMAQAWNIVGGLANQTSLGHAAFFGIGAYTSTILLLKLGVSPWLGLIVGMVLAAGVAALLAIPTLKLAGHYFALATLAFAEVLRIVANSLTPLTGGPQGLSIPFLPNAGFASFQFGSTVSYYYIMVAAFVLISAIFWAMKTTAFGYRLRAVRENEDAAEVAGVNTFRTKLIALMVSAALTALCGTLFAQFNFFFDPDSVFGAAGISIRMALIAIIGGIGSLAGPLLGAVFLLPLEELINATLSSRVAGLSQLIYGVILIVMILVKPAGFVSLFKGRKWNWLK